MHLQWRQHSSSLFIKALVFLQESEPISKYLSPEVPAAVKRRIARMGVELLLKMVGEI